MTAIDPRSLRDAFGSFLTGVTVVTARDAAGTPVGFTANSFSSVSLDPPLLLVCPARGLSSFPVFETCGHFAVNILAEGQEDVSNTFARHKGDRFAQVGWRADTAGCPLIEGAVAQFSCRTAQVVPAGDHVILVGAVEAFARSGARGLGYRGGRYFSLGLEREAASAPPPGQRAVAGAIVERDGHVLLEEMPEGWRPPQLPLGERVRVRAALAGWLSGAGLDVALGRAYSVFDDRGTGTHFTYFLGQAGSAATGGLGRWVPIATLGGLRFASAALTTMMARFALEYETRCFGLYVGDEAAGDVHTLPQGS
jgi:flavin reductase (DIM6/NTAB) family NADH-FMN oxidoreductase RutF